MLSITATPGSIAGALVDASGGLVLAQGGEAYQTRVEIFEQIFLVFMLLGTLVGLVVITYTLYNAYTYRSGNESADDTTDRPQLGELPIGAEKGGRKLFLSFFISALIVVSLITWTYGMLIVVEAGGDVEDPEDAALEVGVDGVYPGWIFEYQDDERIPDRAATQLVIAAEDDEFTELTDVDDIQDGELVELVAAVRAEADEIDEDPDRQYSEDFQRRSLQPNLQQSGEMTVPVDGQVYIYVTAADRWHNFGIPEFRVKTDAIPGEVNEDWFVADETGTYEDGIECFELCGDLHSVMVADLVVLEEDEFDDWYEGQTASAADIRADPSQFYEPEADDETDGNDGDTGDETDGNDADTGDDADSLADVTAGADGSHAGIAGVHVGPAIESTLDHYAASATVDAPTIVS